MVAIFHVFLSRDVTKALRRWLRNKQSDAEVYFSYVHIFNNLFSE